MQPALWKPPVALTQQEEHMVKKIRKAKLFDEAFRQRLIEGQMDRCGEPDVSRIPTIRLRHALKKVMSVVADQQGRELIEVAKEAGAELVCTTSLKAALAPRLGTDESAGRSS